MSSEVDEDDCCPVCRLLLFDPVTTNCNHTLCKACLEAWIAASCQERIVPIDDDPPDFNITVASEARCPMCRTLTRAVLNESRKTELCKKYGQLYADREAEEQFGFVNDAGQSFQMLTIAVGNKHIRARTTEDDPNQHEWTFFIRPSRTDVIEEVHIFLHPSFRRNTAVRTRPPFEITRVGWGTFIISAAVILKAGYRWDSDDAIDTPGGFSQGLLMLDWLLDFTSFGGTGAMCRRKVRVRNDRNWENIANETAVEISEMRRRLRSYEQDGRYEPPNE